MAAPRTRPSRRTPRCTSVSALSQAEIASTRAGRRSMGSENLCHMGYKVTRYSTTLG